MQDLFLIGSIPWWVIAVVACGSVALLVNFFRSSSGWALGRVRFWFFFAPALRLAHFFFRPPWWKRGEVASTAHGSGGQLISMSFPADPKPTQDGQPVKSRLDLVRERLLAGEEPLIQELSRDYDLRLYRFGTALEPIAPASISQLKAQDQGTRLLEVLQSAAREAGEQSGILFGDGIANGDRNL
jgi:hypothetical protein